MFNRKAQSFMFSVVLLCAANMAHAALHSPWDGHSVEVTDVPYTCSPVQQLSPDLTTDGFYSDSRSSVIDPTKWKAYAESSGPYKQLGQEIVSAADAYRQTGSRAAAECALLHMTAAAKQGVFTGRMSSRQAYYVQGWVIGAIAISYLKIQGSEQITSEEKQLILPWLVEVVHQSTGYYDSGKPQKNNHLYWAGVEAVAAGVAADNHTLLDWGVNAYKTGIDQIQPDGSLPLEMRRGQRALHYHLYALAPLVYIAEFGEDNGLHLYAERDHALARLVHLSIDGLNNNSYFVEATGIPQDTPGSSLMAEQISWAEIWQSRFPDARVAELLGHARSMSYMYLGGLPPGSNQAQSR